MSTTPDWSKVADLFEQVAQELRAGDTTPPDPTPTPQPTGSQMPILNDARIAILKKMQAANSPEWQRLKATADAPTAQYDDNGRAAAIVYRVTGDTNYAAKSYASLMATLNSAGVLNANNVREYLLEFCLIYVWVRDALTADQKTAFETAISKWSDFALGRNQANANLGGFRTGDSDQTIGQFFGLAFMDAAGIGPGNLTSQTGAASSPTPVGGLTVTGDDMSTARNAIKYFCTHQAAGGTWFESCEYNSNTVVLLLMGWEAMYDILGVDHFPEIGEWAVSACNAVLTSYTPDFKSRIEWGDDERAGQLDWFEQIPYLAAMQHAAARLGHTAEAGHVASMLSAMLAINGTGAFRQRYYYFCEPDVAPIPYYDGKGPLANYSPGVGLFSRFDGGNLLAIFSPSNTECDHVNSFIGDLTWYSGGEWVLHHPATYGGIANTAVGNNSPLVSGLSAMDARGPVDCVTTPDYAYFVGQTHGTFYGPWKAWVAAPFCNELTRTVFYLPKQNAIVLCDRFNSVDPASVLPGGDMSVYYQPEKDAIAAASGPGLRHQNNWHAPVAPMIAPFATNGITLSWATPGGQQVEIASYSPQGPLTTEVFDEAKFLANATGKQVRVHPTDDQQFRMLLTCIRLAPSAVEPQSVQQVGVAGFTVDGVTVLFGTDQASRLIDPSKATTSGTTYLVGCSGANSVVKQG